jgi:hypothetical protein
MAKEHKIDWEKVIKAIVSAADNDLGKQLDEDTAEEPESAKDFLAELVRIAKKVAGEK